MVLDSGRANCFPSDFAHIVFGSAFHEFCRPYIVVFVKKPLVIKEKG